MYRNIFGKKISSKKELQLQINKLQTQYTEREEACLEMQETCKNLEAQNTELHKEVQQMECLCHDLEEEKERVYAGHRGLEEEINFLKYRISTLDNLHESVVQKKWPHDGSMQKYGCLYPFMRVEILPRGEVYTCCSAYLKHNYYIGNIYEEDFSQIWNSFRARNLRKSVMEGNFEYCTELCRFLHEVKNDWGGGIAV